MSQRRILTRAVGGLLLAVAVMSVTACGSSRETAPESTRQLTEIKERMNALDRRVNAVPTGQPVTQASLTRYAAALQPLIAEYGDLLTDAEASHKSVLPIKDSTVSTLWLVLIKRIRASHDGLARTKSLIQHRRWNSLLPATNAFYAEIERLDAELTRQATALN